MSHELNRLSHWFPKLVEAGLPVPATKIVEMERSVRHYFGSLLFDGDTDHPPPPMVYDFLGSIESAVKEVGGYPAFLRTDMTSGKHEWERTCFLPRPEELFSHIVALIEFSETVDIMGLPWDTWVVREMLPTRSRFTAFHGMPIVPEFRTFARDGEILCHHPYWPAEAIEGHTDDPYWVEKLEEMNRMPRAGPHDLARRSSRALPGQAWSIDCVRTARGWFVIDMATEETSWHWPECERVREGR